VPHTQSGPSENVGRLAQKLWRCNQRVPWRLKETDEAYDQAAGRIDEPDDDIRVQHDSHQVWPERTSTIVRSISSSSSPCEAPVAATWPWNGDTLAMSASHRLRCRGELVEKHEEHLPLSADAVPDQRLDGLPIRSREVINVADDTFHAHNSTII
jgi:hypothetical protein